MWSSGGGCLCITVCVIDQYIYVWRFWGLSEYSMIREHRHVVFQKSRLPHIQVESILSLSWILRERVVVETLKVLCITKKMSNSYTKIITYLSLKLYLKNFTDNFFIILSDK